MTEQERRTSTRKGISGVDASDITSLDNYRVIAKYGKIVDASINGFLIQVDRGDLSKDLKSQLHLENLVGQGIAMVLPQMNLDLDGSIIRSSHIGGGMFELAVQFSSDVPEYWRECLIDLLPDAEELEAFEQLLS